MNHAPDNSHENPRPRRRKRYAGKYPRRPDERYKELAPDKFPEIHGHIRAQGRTPAGTHVPVMVAEVMQALRPAPGETVVDCTVGYGGHAMEFLKRIGPTGRLIGFDVDEVYLAQTRERLAEGRGQADGTGHEPCAVGPLTPSAPLPGGSPEPPRILLMRRNFAGVDRALAELGVDGCDVLFADLGVASMQLDDPARGFSYKFDGPLDMRMDSRHPRTAADLLRIMPESKLAAALADLADEPDAAAIARRIVEGREVRPITRTLELVELIFEAKGLSRRGGGHGRGRASAGSAGRGERGQVSQEGGDLHPAARTFQALRILVNDELAALGQLLRVAPACLRSGGRIGIISFHSGEDRLVKHAFRDGLATGAYAAISEEVIRPGPEERFSNPRSASAKFRWARTNSGPKHG